MQFSVATLMRMHAAIIYGYSYKGMLSKSIPLVGRA